MRILNLLIPVLFISCSTSTESEQSTSSWDTTRVDEEYLRKPEPGSLPGDRRSWQNPDLVLDKLGNLDGKIVADIGAGTGYFTFRLADRGADVVAIDIEEDYLSYIDNRKDELPSLNPGQIRIRLSAENDPLLEPNEADIVLLVNTYAFLSDRIEYLRKVSTGLVDNGLICIVDYKSSDVPIISKEAPVLKSDLVVRELREAGFVNIELDARSLEFQYIITANK